MPCGRDALSAAFSALGLVAVTAEAPGALDGMTAIDHLNVGWECLVVAVRIEHPAVDGRALSDHPLYLADPATRSGH